MGDPISAPLRQAAAEALSRLELVPPGPCPQPLACLDGRCLLRTAQGLADLAVDQLPASLDLAPLIDHTLLKADARQEDIDRLCDDALELGFASVCVNPLWVARCAARLQGSQVRTCTVAGFPLGASAARVKAAEAREAHGDGAQEIDVVLSVGLVRMGEWDAVARELGLVRAAVPHAVLKVILETCLLSDADKEQACRMALREGADFVKTSTGFSSGGATPGDVSLMRRCVGASAGVKASGGIRTYDSALAMVLAGATRLGLSASRTVVERT